jgi:hypothetical protein
MNSTTAEDSSNSPWPNSISYSGALNKQPSKGNRHVVGHQVTTPHIVPREVHPKTLQQVGCPFTMLNTRGVSNSVDVDADSKRKRITVRGREYDAKPVLVASTLQALSSGGTQNPSSVLDELNQHLVNHLPTVLRHQQATNNRFIIYNSTQKNTNMT